RKVRLGWARLQARPVEPTAVMLGTVESGSRPFLKPGGSQRAITEEPAKRVLQVTACPRVQPRGETVEPVGPASLGPALRCGLSQSLIILRRSLLPADGPVGTSCGEALTPGARPGLISSGVKLGCAWVAGSDWVGPRSVVIAGTHPGRAVGPLRTFERL